MSRFEKIASPFENLLQMYIVEKAEGFCKIGVRHRKELTNPHNNFHGGLIASIIDTAVVQALRTISPLGPYLTVHLEVRYKSPSQDDEIFAIAHPSHLRGKFFQTEVEVVNKKNAVIAQAKVKSFLPSFSPTT